jgi:hypothetical protein
MSKPRKFPFGKPSGFVWTDEERGISQGSRQYGAVYHCTQCGGRRQSWDGDFGRRWFHATGCPNAPVAPKLEGES